MNKKNLTLLIILAVLLGVAGVYQYLWLPKQNISSRQDNWLTQVNFNEADKIIINLDGVEIILNREAERWRVAGDGEWYVNTILVDNFKEAWQTAASSSLYVVSNNKDTKADFKTDGSFSLKLFAKDKELIDLAFGSTRAGYTYVSKSDIDSTFEVGGDLRQAFDYEEWRDFNIFNVDKNKFEQIKITQGKNSLLLKKEGENWQVANQPKLKLNQEKVARLVALMGELSANSIPNQKSKDTGLDKNNWTVEATGSGVKNVLIIGQEAIMDKQPSNNLFVKNSASSNIYLVGKDILGVFQTKVKDLTI